ncbi:YodC family protein [Yersinia enterocolitica]|uniref:YodC family protein n=1 Tax=Yersinia TaxID=629 RepID=UPI000BF1F65E|nr:MULTISPECIES: DUF2158 domain-containing protein [Yersinia]PNK73320.1 DUF2158 domain-containing protein [Yersinia enterocolitica]UXD29188.1 hypothetical protein FORC066_1975 [Yersinia enterocolitica]UYJ82478.1 YodC family protein [Yersinia enterocolitica]HDL7825148.1 DUF2158 domain-containing protein [Yersinia enterocolitica]HDL7831463.1 DUF2158 domain-containing protein [Yersinia enterocolitica]
MSNTARMPKFKIGDIVYLVTGGPSMSISEALNEHKNGSRGFHGNYKCQWFAGKKLDQGLFPEESLTPTNPKP